jgi:hypothetical protein
MIRWGRSIRLLIDMQQADKSHWKDKDEAFARFTHSFYINTYTFDCGTSQTHDLDRGRELHIRVGKLQGSSAT